MAQSKTPQVKDATHLIQLLDTGYVLNDPRDKRLAEITLPGEDVVEYECDSLHWFALLALFAKPGHKELYRKVWLAEPGMAPHWAIVCSSNRSALEYESTPERDPVPPSEDEDEAP